MNSTLLRFIAEPGSQHFQHRVPAGLVAKWVDEAATTVASQWARGACWTSHLGCLRLYRSVMAGDMVEVEARLAATDDAQMHLYVEVRSGDLLDAELQLLVHTVVVCVAVDAQGQPAPVDRWNPETPGDMALAQRVVAALAALPSEL